MYYASSHGYGDSKAFPNVENADGPEKPVKMYECVDYYKKRVGHVFEWKKDVKVIGGNVRLNDAKIDTLQKYFGIALRQNAGDIGKIISACKAWLS